MWTRDEYLARCKRRALEWAESGDLVNAVAVMMSDLKKHSGFPETETSDFLWAIAIKAAADSDKAGVVRWINGIT